MISKSTIKFVQSLKLKKFRQKYNLFVAEGQKVVMTMLQHDQFIVSRVFTSVEHIDQLLKILPEEQIVKAEKNELKKLSLLSTYSDIMALFEIPDVADVSKPSGDKVIYLDDIQDPGNLGTIIRIADWYGIKTVVRSEGSADFYNPKVVQAAMGSLGHVRGISIKKTNFKSSFINYQVVAASLKNGNKSEINTGSPICLVVGNEGHGISTEIIPSIDFHWKIKGAEIRCAESLNAAVATGIICESIFGKILQ